VTLLIALLASFLALVLAVRLVPQISSPEIRVLLVPAALPFGGLILGYLIYEILIRAWLHRLLSSNRLLPRGFQFLNVLVDRLPPSDC
jgi:hypothetical protein